jgi:hypothetical protein
MLANWHDLFTTTGEVSEGHRGIMEVLVQTDRDRGMMTEWNGSYRPKYCFKGRHFDGQIIILCVSWYTSSS